MNLKSLDCATYANMNKITVFPQREKSFSNFWKSGLSMFISVLSSIKEDIWIYDLKF